MKRGWYEDLPTAFEATLCDIPIYDSDDFYEFDSYLKAKIHQTEY